MRNCYENNGIYPFLCQTFKVKVCLFYHNCSRFVTETLTIKNKNQFEIIMALYPLKFHPILKEKVWGGDYLCKNLKKGTDLDKKVGESWEISTVGTDISVVSNGKLAGNNLQELLEVYMTELVGAKIYERYGNYFPILLKFIDAQDDLSIQVHPDDELGLEKYNSFGKTEMWYIFDANDTGKIVSGFKKSCSPDELRKAVSGPEVMDYLHTEETKKGDVFFIPAGRVHALCAGNIVVEIQQPSDITFRLYDYNRPGQDGKLRDLHIEEGVEATNYSVQKEVRTSYELHPNKPVNLAKTPFFTTNIMELDTVIKRDYYYLDSFVIIIAAEGDFNISYGEGEAVLMQKGDSVLLPAELKDITYSPLTQKAKLIESYIELD